jgi:penicillin-binding protein 2
LHTGMEKVVNELGGTAFEHGHSDLVHIAGKTGTAQVRKGKNKVVEFKGWHPHRDHAWFAGYAPAERPEVAIVVLIEHGGPGGKVAAPVAKEILEKYFTVVKPAHEKRAAP